MQAIRLRTEHMENPMGIDVEHPYLSWNCEGGITQTAYEIRALEGEELLWNSGKVVGGAMHAYYGGELASRRKVSWSVRLWDEAGACGEWSGSASFETGLLSQDDFVAEWVNPELETDAEKRQPASVLKKTFRAKAGKSARAYVTCHGNYEAYINGERVGDFVFAPGTGNYNDKLSYQVYDVTDFVRDGENEVRVILGDGWYRSAAGVEGVRNLFGTELALFFQLEVDKEVVCVSDGTWQATQDGPVLESDMCQGEVYDARKEDESAWGWHGVKIKEVDNAVLAASNSVPIGEFERFEGKVITTPNGETVVDFGQNLAGYVELELTAADGQVITLQHGEALDENGNFTIENYQPGERHVEGGIFQKVTYICKEGKNVYKPHFCIFGFRYAKLEMGAAAEMNGQNGMVSEADGQGGANAAAASVLGDAKFTAIAVYSKMEQTAEFTCSDENVNKLVRNSVWSQKGNFCDVPTDCPTRERAGWTGDAGVFVNTGLYLMDCYPVFRKWLGECRITQYPEGQLRNISPMNNNESFFGKLLSGSAGWGDASVIVPYTMYQRYQDVRILEENYEMMKGWVNYLEGRAKAGSTSEEAQKNPYKEYCIDNGVDYGEWCEPGVGVEGVEQNGQTGVATAYLSYSAGMLGEIARILGHGEDAEHFGEVSENARRAFQFTQTENGKIDSKRQCMYVRPLAFGLLEEEDAKRAAADLDALVAENGYHLNTGFLSTPFLCEMLTKYGYTETAYKLLLQDTIPSWLYEVKKGATTVWETWDGIKEDGTVHASLNHYSYGSISGWLVGGVCGIKVKGDEVTVAPNPHPLLKHAKAAYQSPLGRIESGWSYEDGSVKYEFVVPANVKAKIELPDGRSEVVTAGVWKF